MNDKKTLNLETFSMRKISGHMVIKTIGVFPFKLRIERKSRTMGTIIIAGKTFPVLSKLQDIGISNSKVDKDSCVLLVESNKSVADYKVGILVDSVSEVTKVAAEFI